jgi:hypothetical protein
MQEKVNVAVRADGLGQMWYTRPDQTKRKDCYQGEEIMGRVRASSWVAGLFCLIALVGHAEGLQSLDEECYEALPYDDEALSGGLAKRSSHGFPSSFDLRDEFLVPAQSLGDCGDRDQGGCGTCGFFAVTAATEIAAKRKLVLEYPSIPRSNYDLNLSEMELISKSKYDGWLDLIEQPVPQVPSVLVRKIVRKQWTIPLERHNMYDPMVSGASCNFGNAKSDVTRGGVRITRACRLTTYMQQASVAEIKYNLMNYHGVVCYVNVPDESFTYLGGEHGTEDLIPDHNVCIIGWDDNYRGGAWIVRNSWGSGKQVFYMAYTRGKTHLVIKDVEIVRPEYFFEDLFEGRSWDDFYFGTNNCTKSQTWCDGTNGVRLGISRNVVDKEMVSSFKLCLANDWNPYTDSRLGAGGYLMEQWKVTVEVPFDGASVSIVDGLCNGKKTINRECTETNNPYPYGGYVEELDEARKVALLYTYCFRLRDALGDCFWYPQSPDRVQIGYKEYAVSCRKPEISHKVNDMAAILHLLLD